MIALALHLLPAQAFFHHLHQTLADLLHVRAEDLTQRPVYDQHGQPVHRRPGEELGAGTALGLQHAGTHEFVDCNAQKFEGVQPTFRLRKTQVAGAHRADVGAGKFGRR